MVRTATPTAVTTVSLPAIRGAGYISSHSRVLVVRDTSSMHLVDWLLSKLNLALASSALFRVTTGVVGWIAITASWSATPLHVGADLTRNYCRAAAHQFLLGADMWLGQE